MVNGPPSIAGPRAFRAGASRTAGLPLGRIEMPRGPPMRARCTLRARSYFERASSRDARPAQCSAVETRALLVSASPCTPGGLAHPASAVSPDSSARSRNVSSRAHGAPPEPLSPEPLSARREHARSPREHTRSPCEHTRSPCERPCSSRKATGSPREHACCQDMRASPRSGKRVPPARVSAPTPRARTPRRRRRALASRAPITTLRAGWHDPARLCPQLSARIH
jgi:hypothetical protein